MPYIPEPRRKSLTPTSFLEAKLSGELNFQITQLILQYLEPHPLSYANISDVIGTLECVKLELYRRLAAPYEDAKRDENGDVF